MEINEDECQCILFQCSEIDELRQPLTPFGKVANEMLDDTVINCHDY